MKYVKGQELRIVSDTSGHRLPNGSIVRVMEVNKYDYIAISRSNIEVYVNEQDVNSL
tara:strand:+ start:474 stop:644 length:171 start_codon:yes stop_codon:yes gene_type:complete